PPVCGAARRRQTLRFLAGKLDLPALLRLAVEGRGRPTGYDWPAGGICGGGGKLGTTGVGAGRALLPCGVPAARRRISPSGSTRSIGSGKITVEFFSVAISVNVWR